MKGKISMQIKIPLSYNRRCMLEGYLDLLNRAPGNGALVHSAKQLATVITFDLETGSDLTADQDHKVRDVIRKLYREKEYMYG